MLDRASPVFSMPRYLNCPACGLSLARPERWEPENCPRCIARRRVAVKLFASALPSDRLYAAGAAPDREGKRAGVPWGSGI